MRQTVLPLVNRMARSLGGWLEPAGGGDLPLAPDLDQVEALTPEREALWARIGAAEFLSEEEKRAAVGYGDAEEGGDRAARPFARKYRPDQARDDRGRWVEEGGGEDDEGEVEDGGEGGDESESEFEPTAGGGRGKRPPPAAPATQPSTEPQYRTRRSDRSGREAATDVPSWARGERPMVGENGDAFAKRVMDKKYPGQTHQTGPNSEYSQIKKFGDRGFD